MNADIAGSKAVQFGTKAETLEMLLKRGFTVPKVFFFNIDTWQKDSESVMREIDGYFGGNIAALAVRSSAFLEDALGSSMAGAFESCIDVPCDDKSALSEAIERVINSFNRYSDGQILIQPMVQDVQISGVVLTKALDDGSPYYVINYDDVSGKTDTITSGKGTNKVVYIYNGVEEDDFDSERLKSVLALVRKLEEVFVGSHLDVEFAVDNLGIAHLLQVRRICATKNWNPDIAPEVSKRIQHVEFFIRNSMNEMPGLFGNRTIFSVMSDWNPAEMIGVTPRPLALSLYRELLTKEVWRRARENMGYRALPSVELMVSVVGRPYIDVRASFNSFLPDDVREKTGETLVNAWIDRLDKHPELHDKVEFGVVPTILDFDFEDVMADRYPDILTLTEHGAYADKLRSITNSALQKQSTLHESLEIVKKLKQPQSLPENNNRISDIFALTSRIAKLLAECREYGTFPFAMAARHGFIAESLLRSSVKRGAMTEKRVNEFKRTIRTISGELTEDFKSVFDGRLSRGDFLYRYGHLRPGTYDIMTPCYSNRKDLFDQLTPPEQGEHAASFCLTGKETAQLSLLLQETGLCVSPDELLSYAKNAIAAREYIKFIFSRHVSAILEMLASWGDLLELPRDTVAMLPLESIIGMLYAPLPVNAKEYFAERVLEGQKLYDLTRSFKLSYVIRSERDVYVVPQHRSVPNFITDKRVEAEIFCLDAREAVAGNRLSGAIVCIEAADPGYDWIFSRNIAGLITQYGGSNSHMAIRCAEYALPAAIGCGELIFKQVAASRRCLLDCASNTIIPLGGTGL